MAELPPDRPLRGIALLIAALMCFVGMDVLIKHATASLPAVQILWARLVVHLVAVSVALRLAGRRMPPVSRRPALQAVRSLTLTGCNLTFTLAVTYIPLAEATAIGFLSPLIVLVLAGWWLKETIGLRRWIAVGVGLVGVGVILRPGMGVTHPAAFLVLVTAVLYAFYAVLTRLLARHDDSQTTIFHTGLAGGLLASLVVPFVWMAPSAWGWVQLVALGLFGAVGHYLLILAYAVASASRLAPFSYSQLIWASLFGWLVFGDIPDAATVLGAVIIAAGGLFSLAEGRRRATPGPRPGPGPERGA